MPTRTDQPHLTYRNFRTAAIDATAALFSAKPWRASDTADAETRFLNEGRNWLDQMIAAYEVPAVALDYTQSWAYYQAPYFDEGATIYVTHPPSIYTLFKLFAEHLQANGKLRSDSNRPKLFACSLFYSVKPAMFRKRVREGRIRIPVTGLYSTATLEALERYVIDAEDPNALTLLGIARNAPQLVEDTNVVDAEVVDPDYPSNENEDDDDPSTDDENVVPGLVDEQERPNDDVEQQREQARAFANVRDLRRFATSLGVQGSWNMTRAQILEALGA